MRRTDKYPETMTFRYHNNNPKGRLTTDCTIRAISTFLDISWEQCLREMTEIAIQTGVMIDSKEGIQVYLKSKGYGMLPQPRRENGRKYTGGEFCKELALNRRKYLLNMAGHITVVVDMQVWDTWDCTEKTVGNYWRR